MEIEMSVMASPSEDKDVYIMISDAYTRGIAFKVKQSKLEDCARVIETIQQNIRRVHFVCEPNDVYLLVDRSFDSMVHDIKHVLGWALDTSYPSVRDRKYIPYMYGHLHFVDLSKVKRLDNLYVYPFRVTFRYPVEIHFDGWHGWFVLPFYSVFVFISYPLYWMADVILHNIHIV